MKKYLAIVFVISLFMVEIGSFLWVLQSNQSLKHDLAMLAGSDYLVVPNSHIAPSLGKIMPAFWGSLFITFTAGLVISMVICFVVLIYKKLPYHPVYTVLFLLQTKLRPNTRPSLAVPLNHRQQRGGNNPDPRLAARLAVPGIFLAGTLIILAMFTDQSIFHRTRDYLLLSNPLGTAVSKLYYTYSPYAVNAVQPPLGKHVKTVWISPHAGNKAVLKNILSRFGWFQVKSIDATSFVVRNTDRNHLTFLAKDKKILTVAAADFIADPARYLKQYSQKTDPARFIRHLCVAGLLMGMPVCLFLSVFLFYSLLLSFIMPVMLARFFSGILVLTTAAGLTVYLYPKHPANPDGIRDMIFSRHVKHRIEGLRLLSGKGMDSNDIQDTLGGKIHSKSIAERYWVAKLLAQSKAPQSIHMLKQMLNDPEIIVVCAAIKSLSRRSASSQTIDLLKALAQTRPEWYVQITAYNAVKAYHGG